MRFRQPIPPTIPIQQLAGKTVVFRLSIQGDQAKKLGRRWTMSSRKTAGPISSLEELRDKLRAEMERASRKISRTSYKDHIFKRLAETHHFDLPDTLGRA